jgi:1,4-alpha-glucan branching enzyme
VPRWAQLAAAALVLIAVTAGVTMKLTGGAGGDTIVVHLHLKAPDAQKVSVVGDWNDWEPQANPLRDENGDGIWETKVRIPKEGEYQYQFLINGERWVPDPNAPIQVEDGFGGTNSVLDI